VCTKGGAIGVGVAKLQERDHRCRSEGAEKWAAGERRKAKTAKNAASSSALNTINLYSLAHKVTVRPTMSLDEAFVRTKLAIRRMPTVLRSVPSPRTTQKFASVSAKAPFRSLASDRIRLDAGFNCVEHLGGHACQT
jgi:hypothetical protein